MTKNGFLGFLQRITGSKSVLLAILAGLLGLLTGGGVWLFKFLYNALTGFSFTTLLNRMPAEKYGLVALIPLVGGALVGLMDHYLGGKEKISGTAGVIQSVEIAGGRLRYQHLPEKTAAAILSIGTGASVGPEDPSVQIGANLGSFFGQIFHLSETHTSTLVAAGAAAAIAAAFNAPIAGVFFALEIVVGDLAGASLGMVLIAAVTSSVFTQAVSGAQPAFLVPTYTMNSPWELILYVGLGLLAGPISALYVYLLYWAQDFFGHRKWPRWMQTAMAGLVVGCVGIFLPQVFGVGYNTIGTIISGQKLAVGLLLALVIAKLVLTAVSIGGGFAGGVFAPSLFIGAALGGAYGFAMAALFPALGITPSAYALIGMAAVLAGAVHAPLTASILLFEMTGDYRIILPLMLAVAISLLISQRIQPRSIYSLGLARKGFYLNRGREIDVLDTVLVKEAMNTEMKPLVETDLIKTVRRRFNSVHSRGLPVVDQKGFLNGIITSSDLENLIDRNGNKTIQGLYQTHAAVTYPQETLATALKKMSELEVGQLPVVLVEDPRHLVGMLYRQDVIHAYAVASQRRLDQRYAAQRDRLDAVTPEQVGVREFFVHGNAEIVGKAMHEIKFPLDCVVASIKRRNQVVVPRGDTIVLGGDILVVVSQDQSLSEVDALCQARILEPNDNTL